MLGASMPQPHIAALDRLLPRIIAADNQVARNVYLFSSPADYQYEEEIKPHLHLLLKYGNFNLILSNSTLVRGHGEVAAYNTPMLLGILNALSRGATPRFTFDPPQPEPASQAARHLQRLRARKAIAAQLRGARIAEGRIRVAGHALALGYGCGEADPPTRTLVLKRGASEYRVPVASRLDRTLPRRSFDACFCDYSTAGFDTEDGIETAALQPGRYTLHINLSSRDGQLHHTTPLVAAKPFEQCSPDGDREIVISADHTGAAVIVRDIVGRRYGESVFSVTNRWLRGRLLHVEGVYFRRGFEWPTTKTPTTTSCCAARRGSSRSGWGNPSGTRRFASMSPTTISSAMTKPTSRPRAIAASISAACPLVTTKPSSR